MFPARERFLRTEFLVKPPQISLAPSSSILFLASDLKDFLPKFSVVTAVFVAKKFAINLAHGSSMKLLTKMETVNLLRSSSVRVVLVSKAVNNFLIPSMVTLLFPIVIYPTVPR